MVCHQPLVEFGPGIDFLRIADRPELGFQRTRVTAAAAFFNKIVNFIGIA